MTENNDEHRHYAIEVKPIGSACNLRCEYCYYLGKGSGNHATPALMSDDVLEHYIQQVIAIHGRKAEIEFAWHGGEPTMGGIPFFRRAMQLQNKYGKGRRILNTLQTNGTLLNDDWCRFFREHNFRIGVSIDGPEHLHNIYRKDLHGEGSFARTMHGLELLQKHGVEFNTLTTVNATNAKHAAEIYDFLRQFSDFMQFLPVVEQTQTISGEEGSDISHEQEKSNLAMPPGLYTPLNHREELKMGNFSVSPGDYGRFLCTILDRWLANDVGHKFVQVIEAAIGNITRRPAGLCVHEAVCGHCGVIEKNGDLYRCDRYVFPEYRIGNIMDSQLYHLMQTNRNFGEYKIDSLPSKCLHCEVADLCFGGCPKDRLIEYLTFNGVERINYLCKGYKTFFDYFRQKYPQIERKISKNLS